MTHARLLRSSALFLMLAASVACKKSSSSTSPDPAATPADSATPTRPVDPANLAGMYKILSAANPGGGGAYTGTVEITKRADFYSLAWNIPNTPAYHGVGIVQGNVFGVGWGLGKAYGVAVYKVSGGNLDGTWATSSTTTHAGTEKLTGPAGLNGTYRISDAKDGDSGKAYTGTVTIAASGSVREVTWKISGGETYSGVGILEGDVFTVGWGTAGAGAGVVMYKIGDKLDGSWAQPRGTQTGTEVLGRI